MTFQDIDVVVTAGLGMISLNRPEKSNALRPQTLQELCRGVDELSQNDAVRVLVLRGNGKHFSAGADFEFLDRLTAMPSVAIQQEIYAHFQGAARRIYQCPKPTVALVSGAAVTVGCELALACDFRIASEDAKFQESWIKLGLMPPLGGLFLLPRLIGLGRAAQMVLRGEAVSGLAAVAMGLATEAVPADRIDERGRAFATELAGLPPVAYATVKEALHRGLESSMQSEWTANIIAQAMLLGTEDFREGLAAVKERRPPKFAGR
jgi:enoyl-CoA hydratase/carnithine racemase